MGSSFVAGGEGSAPPPVTRQQISPPCCRTRATGIAADQSRKSSVQSTALPPNWPRLPRPDRGSSGEPQHAATPSTSGRLHPPTMPRPLPNQSAKRRRASDSHAFLPRFVLSIGISALLYLTQKYTNLSIAELAGGHEPLTVRSVAAVVFVASSSVACVCAFPALWWRHPPCGVRRAISAVFFASLVVAGLCLIAVRLLVRME